MKKQIFTFETLSAIFFGVIIFSAFIAVVVKTLF